MDYQTYRFSKKEKMLNVLVFLVLVGVISYLFYRSVIAFLLLLVLFPLFIKIRKEDGKKKRQQLLAEQFLSGMQSVSTALTAGYSVETAFEEALMELRNMYNEEALIVGEFRYIVSQLHMNRNLEELLCGLALRSGIEDIRDFADVFSAAKRTGGNLVSIIRNTILCVSQKEETRMEIQTCLSAKKLEQNIMSLVPCLILFYVQVMSPGFLDVMYHNAAGTIIMTICLLIYVGAWYWGRKIVDIEV